MALKKVTSTLAPALLTLLLLGGLMAWVMIANSGDPLALARLGTRFSQGDPEGTTGYDGQYVYYIARDLNPETVAERIDVPAYRYQRILLPLLARLLSFGNLDAIPWVLATLGLFSQFAGTWTFAILLRRWGINPWYALVYGLWVGLVLAVRLDLSEPLAYGLVIAAILAQDDDRHPLAWVLYGLALFAKEMTVIFIAAQGLLYLWQRDWSRAFRLGICTLLPFGLFQFWLLSTFGSFGIGVGGEMATPFEWIPLMGLLRIGAFSQTLLWASLVVFGPFVLLPAFWGIWTAAVEIFQRRVDLTVIALALNAIIIPFLPFAVFREPGGLLRFICGLVIAVLLYGARHRHRRVLLYAPLWLILNVFLLKGAG